MTRPVVLNRGGEAPPQGGAKSFQRGRKL